VCTASGIAEAVGFIDCSERDTRQRKREQNRWERGNLSDLLEAASAEWALLSKISLSRVRHRILWWYGARSLSRPPIRASWTLGKDALGLAHIRLNLHGIPSGATNATPCTQPLRPIPNAMACIITKSGPAHDVGCGRPATYGTLQWRERSEPTRRRSYSTVIPQPILPDSRTNLFLRPSPIATVPFRAARLLLWSTDG